MARLIRNLLAALILLAAAAALFSYARNYVRQHPQDFPWTPLRLTDPVGAFTSLKLAALADDTAQCRALISEAGARHVAVAPRSSGPDCGYDNGTLIVAAGGDSAFAPAGLITSCPVAAALFSFERKVLQPAAERHFGSRIATIEHAGSYSCRRIYGRQYGRFSEHARANAVDLAGFRLASGERITVRRDWNASPAKGAFLRDVRDGACRLFATTLSPDYNRAHADHLHLDLARRGEFGGRLCR